MTLIKLQGKLPRKISVAVSGGVDSMVALDFLKRNHVVTVLHYNHGTGHSHQRRGRTRISVVRTTPRTRTDYP